jgi:hypothetical protein
MLKVYLCAFLNQVYIEEARICIESLRINGCFSGPIYLFTDHDVEITGVEIIKVECESVPLSASFRTRLFEYINDFTIDDIFLYLDTDIVILKSLPSFDSISEKIHVYGYPSRTQEGNNFSGFITDDLKYTSATAINSGILLFRPSEKVKEVFNDTYDLYKKLILEGKLNSCWEQPALCFMLIKQDMCDISLNKLVCEERALPKNIDSCIFNHFCGLRGKFRYISMKKYLHLSND